MSIASQQTPELIASLHYLSHSSLHSIVVIVTMLKAHALPTFASWITILPAVLADMSHKPTLAMCQESTCDDGNGEGCPVQITSSGDGFPSCKVYDTDDVLNIGDFEGAEGGYVLCFPGFPRIRC